jgi:hypothetical protein
MFSPAVLVNVGTRGRTIFNGDACVQMHQNRDSHVLSGSP